MKHGLAWCLMLAAVPLAGLAQTSTPATPPALVGKLQISGSSTVAPVVLELGKRFETRHPGVVITVETGGTGRGVADLLAGKADIGMASRDLQPQEQALFAIPIARDGVAFVVHQSNPVSGLTRAQLLAVFTGKVANWKALGGRDAPIEVVTRSATRSSLEIVAQYLGIGSDTIRAAHVLGDNDAVRRLVAGNRNAIAFLSVGAVDDAMQKGQPLKGLALDGIAPGRGSIRDGSWPLARTLNLLTRRVPAGAAKAFIEYALSSAAREVIIEYDFVPYLD